MHLENFGAYRPDPLGAADDASTRDSAEAARPLRPERLRRRHRSARGGSTCSGSTTSLLLGGRELGANGLVALVALRPACSTRGHAARSTVRRCPRAAGARRRAHRASARALEDSAARRAHRAVTSGKRHFVRGPRYADLPADVVAAVPEAFEAYVAGAPRRGSAAQGLARASSTARCASPAPEASAAFASRCSSRARAGPTAAGSST